MNIADKLINNTIKTRNSVVVGLDPDITKIPDCYKHITPSEKPLKDVADVILEYNKDIIDTVCEIVPAVKPQIAFYEKYGSVGFEAFEKTVSYAKSKGLVVIEDGKRNDIGNTARAYADGHLGRVSLLDGSTKPMVDADFLTISPFLGSESLAPFVEVCKQHDKGIFILVKTSNTSSGEIQDVITASGFTVSQSLAKYVAEVSNECVGDFGYSSIGAVVGATYPEEAENLRKLMPKSYFLVPGYGAQGGSAKDIVPCFNSDGLGAIVNSSRGILYTHMADEERKVCTKEEYLKSVYDAVLNTREDIYSTLKCYCADMKY